MSSSPASVAPLPESSDRVVPVTSPLAATSTPRQRHKLGMAAPCRRRERLTIRQIATSLVNLQSWVLVTTLILSQFTCIVWDSQTTYQYFLFGQDPTRGPHTLSGNNDEPYSDRSLVCVRQGRLYRPKQLSALLTSNTVRTRVVDTTGTSVSGYRVVARHEIELLDATAKRYELACDVISTTLHPIVQACQAAGFNVVDPSTDLHVLDGVFATEMVAIVNSLPLIILPYYDNANFARYAMPAVDGSACVFHLSGQFDSATAPGAWLDLTNRSEREHKTMEWLGISPKGGATWRNGWLEDPVTGMKWFSDMSSSTNSPKPHNAPTRFFNLLTGQEGDCFNSPELCHPEAFVEWWGPRFSYADTELWVKTLAISNGSRYGLSLYEAVRSSTSRSSFDLAMLISNSTVIMLLLRWLAASVALFNTYRLGLGCQQPVVFAGIGCLACAHSFECLPLILLPRLSIALAAFFASGCQLEGEQRAFTEAWLAIYPALAEVMLFYYGVLNLVAKSLGRRMNDTLFGPSLFVLCLLHWFRRPLANAGWFEFDGRISTVISAREFEKLHLLDYFTSNAALRLNGDVWSIFCFKLGVLAVNLLPLIFSSKTTKPPWSLQEPICSNDNIVIVPVTAIERALGVRASDSRGLGPSPACIVLQEKPHRLLDSYELVRLGYCVFGESFVILLKDWLVILLLAALRARMRPFGLRVMAVRVTRNEEAQATGKPRPRWEVTPDKLRLYQLDDAQLASVGVWDVKAMPLS